ncbi:MULTISPECIES: helix-turn-helix domain-containing protein [Oerskovia]|uniref:Helix-turn-helix domain-containing protein n=1 Tax=Oerskovia gallyi TaxID=2762226 RepID=A0ABR8UYA6_9CELL|nr:helix-turn-helix domain-containing protein [Oerskovia gallyi]MBD7997524.1 helix-turn-helix domain-containing protein [Oerskovia gallyi]
MDAPADASDDPFAAALEAVGPRLRALRQRRQLTLVDLSDRTGISVSTLSRLESGGRRPTLELLLPLAREHEVPLDELVGAPPTGDPRIHARPVKRGDSTILPLSRRPGGVQAYKQVLHGRTSDVLPETKVHEGYEWLYVLGGRLRLLLGEHDLVLGEGEAAEFDTRTPHAILNADEHPVELLVLHGPQGERAHFRARPKQRRAD